MLRKSWITLLSVACACSSLWGADWTQLQADAKRSGFSPDAVRPPFKMKWAWFGEATQLPDQPPPQRATAKIGSLVQPIVAQGQVFVGAMDGTLYSIDQEKGTTRWQFKTGRAILQTAAYADGIVIVNSMDGGVYGVKADTGEQAWKYETPVGILSAPAIDGGNVYVTTRDGRALALAVKTGKLVWELNVGAPIVNSPAVLDGVMLFGSEDMFAHAVDVKTGLEIWKTKIPGQSLRSTWPVAYKDMVFFTVIPAISGSEMQLLWDPNMEALLDACPPDNWPAEREALRKYLTENPQRQTVMILDIKTGKPKYKEQPPIGYVAGNMYPPMPAVYDDKGQIYIYWRTCSSRLARSGRQEGHGTYGTKYIPDISWLDPATGDRVMLPFGRIKNNVSVELDNNFLLTLGGDVVYGSNHFRVDLLMDMRDGEFYGITKPFKDEKDGGYPVPQGTSWHYPVRGNQPPAPGGGTNGEAGIVPAGNCVYINETGANCVSCFVGTVSTTQPTSKTAETSTRAEGAK